VASARVVYDVKEEACRGLCLNRLSSAEVIELSIERFGVSMDAELLARFDTRIAAAGYTNRSEAIRDVVRGYLVKDEWATGDSEVIGTVTLVYDHHTRLLEDKLLEAQHEHHEMIRCSTHVHLDHHNCLEVIVLSGKAAEVRTVAEALMSIRGVKHGELSCTAACSGL
jgi:CopG family nickel-responsive transcriptional regulator